MALNMRNYSIEGNNGLIHIEPINEKQDITDGNKPQTCFLNTGILDDFS